MVFNHLLKTNKVIEAPASKFWHRILPRIRSEIAYPDVPGDTGPIKTLLAILYHLAERNWLFLVGFIQRIDSTLEFIVSALKVEADPPVVKKIGIYHISLSPRLKPTPILPSVS